MTVILAMLLLIATPALAAPDPPPEDVELAERYAPVLYFHPQEIFRPQTVDVIVSQARLRQRRRLWFDANVLLQLDALDLFDLESDRRHFLDLWYDEQGGSAYANYSAHRAYYEAFLSPEAGGPPTTVYAHVVRDGDSRVTVQYWALYFYNDWFNKHEGDWEMIQVMMEGNEPRWVVLSQHHGGTRRPWNQTPIEEDTHPAAYVALGSHANYFVGDETYPHSQMIGNHKITIVDRTGTAGRVIPDVILLPDRAELMADDETAPPQVAWLPFRGRWGELAPQSDFGGPYGPADKGAQWEQPYAWGMAQPLDTEIWYGHRLRVAVVGPSPDKIDLRLTDRRGEPLPATENLGPLAILHAEPPTTGVSATINVPADAQPKITATWPDREAEHVIHFRFANLPADVSGGTTLQISARGAAWLSLDETNEVVLPTEKEVTEATWEAPDVVWIGDVLPAHQVSTGFLIATLASVIPTGIYIGALYWLDRYEKEPKLLITAAFLWGSVPALALALAAEIFFHLPPTLIGGEVLKAARLGLLTPLLQEALKGLAVLFISLCYRHEFDNVFDGIIYGAVVGFGFAMTSNLIDYVSNFALRGFEGLSLDFFVEGVLYGLDHAFYTAAFGAGLGWARLVKKRWQRWTWSMGGFTLAVAMHTLRNLLTWNMLGVNAVTIATSSAGVLLIGVVSVWSLRRQHRSLHQELKDEIPETLYHAMVTPGEKARMQWRALRALALGRWRRIRRLQQLCAELAFKKMQYRLHTREKTAAIIQELREEIEQMLKQEDLIHTITGSSPPPE
jgi:RsiW-degrading membrane proteinase PrsW (M82 family)